MLAKCFSYNLFGKEPYKIGIFCLSTKLYFGIIQLYLPAKPSKIQEVHVRAGLKADVIGADMCLKQ
jgi:hypothetical protein